MTAADGGTPPTEVLVVLEAVRAVGCRFWLEGGWGVDALVGHQTRPHRDLDLDVDGAFEAEALAAPARLGYVPCVSVAAQRLFRTGYELRDVDRRDLATLDRLTSP